MDLLTLSKHIKNKNVINFIKHLDRKAKKNNIAFNLVNNKFLVENGFVYSGEFDSANKLLTVAIGLNQNIWLPILVHESCHMDQWLEHYKYWNNYPLDKILNWINKKQKLTDKILYKYIYQCVRVERHCELKSIHKIVKWGLPINTHTYIQKTNAYLMYYYAMAHYKTYRNKKKAPYAMKKIWEKMPNTLFKLSDFEKEKDKYVGLYKPIMNIKILGGK